jgi:uncharacterized protein (TIGR02271 family)
MTTQEQYLVNPSIMEDKMVDNRENTNNPADINPDEVESTIQLQEERLRAQKSAVQTGEVNIRKEVTTEMQHLDIPVEREEVVIQHRPVPGEEPASGDISEQEIRIPVMQEKVNVTKEPVVTEEVSIGKRKIKETEHIEDSVRKEKLRVSDEQSLERENAE